jgi:hypothetical protein
VLAVDRRYPDCSGDEYTVVAEAGDDKAQALGWLLLLEADHR